MKKLSHIFVAISLFISSVAHSQIIKTWDRTIAGGDTELPVLVYKNDDGTVDIISTIRNSGNDVTIAYGGRDYWFCRLNSNGQVLLNATYGGSEDDHCKAAIKTSDGGYLIVGTSGSGADGIKTDDLPAGNYNALWLVKVDKDGQLQWQKQVTYGGAAGSDFQSVIDHYEGMAVTKTSVGYSVICSVTSRKLSTNEYQPYSDHCVNFDNNGNVTANIPMSVGNYESHKVQQISVLGNGSIFAVGYGVKNGDTKRYGLAFEYTLSGKVTRTNEFSASGNTEIISAKELNPGGDKIYFAKSKHDNSSGFSRTAVSKSSSVATESDFWVFKTNGIGTNLFDQNSIGCNGDVLGTTLYKPLNNVFYLDGKAHILLEANQVGADKSENSKGKYDFWYVVYDIGTNKIIREKTFGGTDIDKINSLYVDQQNCYLLGISASGISTTVGDKSESNKSSTYDLWVIKACLGVDAPEILNSNPINGINTISGCVNQNLTIQVKNPNQFYTYSWYDASTGGNLLYKGNSFTVNISANKDIWVQAENGNCVSNRIQTKVIMNPTPNKPSMTGKTLICKGGTLTLTAQKDLTPPNQNSTSIWYDSTGSNIISGKDILTISPINFNAKYYLSSINGSCESAKEMVTVNVEELPKAIIPFYSNPDCIYNSTNISIKNPPAGTSVKWLDGQNKYYTTGNPIDYINTNMVDTLKSIIVSSNGCESDAVVNYIRVTYPRPNKPIINNSFTQSGVDYISGCSDQTMDLQIKFANTNYNYNWYDAGLGGNLITQNSVYTTPKLTNVNSYEYWVETNDNYCISERKKVKITVIQTPVKPKVTILGSKICRGDDAVLVAEKDKNTNPIAYYVTKWYDSKNVLLQTGDTLKIKGIKANETIYCTTIDSIPFDFTTKLGPYVCESQATSTSILVDTVATPVVAYTTPSCVGSNIQFNVLNTNINGSVKWFSNSGKLLSTSPTYKIMNIQKNDTVICQAFGINGCTSYKSISIVNVEKPTAAFTSNKTKIEAGDIVLFDNQSINAASYFWDFGDNSTSTQKSPFHYYNNPGTFTVKLGVKAQNGCTDTIVLKDYIYVSDPNGIEELTILNKISAFPIPFSDQLQIELPSELNSVKVTMVNEVGQTIFSKIINSKEIIGTNQISPGFYFLRFEINGSIKIIKLAKL